MTTGLLARVEDEAQLALVLGHEVTHATHRHATVEYRTFKNGAALSAAIPGAGVLGLGALGTKAAVTGYSREFEREADATGLAAVAAAGYEVASAVKVFEHLRDWIVEEKEDEPYFLGDHPRIAERIETMAALRAAPGFKAPGRDRGEVRYRAAVRGILLANARLDLAAGRFGRAERGARAR